MQMVKIRLLAAALALALLPQISSASERAPQRHDAEGVFRSWLNAFNSGDPAEIKAFYASYTGTSNPAFALESAEDTCGLTVERIAARSTRAMTVLLRQTCLPGLQRLTLELAATDSTTLKTLELRPLPLAGDGAVAVTAAIAGRLASRDAFAGSLIIRRGSTTLLAHSWGLADPAGRTPMTLDTPMFLASAGKMFTSVAVLQLVDEGKVDLDAPLGRYLPDYPNAEMAKVTIRQLLTHRGGTGDIGILARGDGANRTKVRTISDMIRLNGARGPAFPPGTKAEYSNYGFILLGAVIEKVTHTSYYDYVRRRVFDPAGMIASGFPDRDHLGGVAIGYTTYFNEEPRQIANLDTLPWRGASAGGGGKRDRCAAVLRCDEIRPSTVAGHVQAGDNGRCDPVVRHGICRQLPRGELGPRGQFLWDGRGDALLSHSRHNVHLPGCPRHGVQPSDPCMVLKDVQSRNLGHKQPPLR